MQWSSIENRVVCIALKSLMDQNLLSGPAETHLTMAQERALPDKRRHRKWYSSTASVFKSKIFNPLLQSGELNGTRSVIKPSLQEPTVTPPTPTAVKVEAPVPPPSNGREPRIHIQMANGTPTTVDQSVYEGVIKHYKTSHPPAPIVKPTLDSIFSEMIDARLKDVLPKMLGDFTAKLDDRFNGVERKIAENFNQFMQYLDPKWADIKEEIQKKEEVEPAPPEVVVKPQEPVPAEVTPPLPTILEKKDRRPIVVLVNANAVQQSTVQKEFPNIDIRASMNRVPGDSSPLLVVGFTRFMDHSLDGRCSKKFGSSYIRLPTASAATDAKRRIREHLAKIGF